MKLKCAECDRRKPAHVADSPSAVSPFVATDDISSFDDLRCSDADRRPLRDRSIVVAVEASIGRWPARRQDQHGASPARSAWLDSHRRSRTWPEESIPEVSPSLLRRFDDSIAPLRTLARSVSRRFEIVHEAASSRVGSSSSNGSSASSRPRPDVTARRQRVAVFANLVDRGCFAEPGDFVRSSARLNDR